MTSSVSESLPKWIGGVFRDIFSTEIPETGTVSLLLTHQKPKSVLLYGRSCCGHVAGSLEHKCCARAGGWKRWPRANLIDSVGLEPKTLGVDGLKTPFAKAIMRSAMLVFDGNVAWGCEKAGHLPLVSGWRVDWWIII